MNSLLTEHVFVISKIDRLNFPPKAILNPVILVLTHLEFLYSTVGFVHLCQGRSADTRTAKRQPLIDKNGNNSATKLQEVTSFPDIRLI